ncbi:MULTISPECIES: minor capsid protein [unclassified Levilactobacillus]|uniref:minor capsid protein n=1 Tax=Lactobacillaceae TaxID=33958 RepID=UPI0014570B68|nr:minor capsid protein [Lactobacillus sp. HBUAS51381]
MKKTRNLSTSIVVFLILDVTLGVIFFLLGQAILWSTIIAAVLAVIYWSFPQISRLIGLNRPQSDQPEIPAEQRHYDFYQLNCQLDKHTCPDCGTQDGRIYRTDEALPGRNYPPFHPGCRCTATPCTGELPATPNRQYRDPQTDDYQTGPYLTYADWRKAMIAQYGAHIFSSKNSPK